MADEVENRGDLFDPYPVVSENCPDNLSFTLESLFAILDEDPGPTQSQGADIGKGLDEGLLGPDTVDPDNTFQPRVGNPKCTAVLEDFTNELASSEWDKSSCGQASDCKRERGSGFLFHPKGNFHNISSSCYPYSIDNDIRHDSRHRDSENFHSISSNHSSDLLELSTLDCNSRSMGLAGGSFDNLMNVNLNHKQLHNNIPDCSVELDGAEEAGLSYSHYADFENGFFLDRDQAKELEHMEDEIPFQAGVKESVSDADTVSSLHVMQKVSDSMVPDGNFCPSVSLYSSMDTDANVPGAFHNEMEMTDTTDAMFHANHSCLTLHQECATDDAKNELRQFLSGQFCQSVVSNEKEELIHMNDKIVDQLFPSRVSCRSGEVKLSVQEESLGTEFSVIDLDASLPENLCLEQDHCEEISFRGESSTDSSPLPSSRNSTSDNVDRSVVDMSNHMTPDSNINLLSRRQHTFPKNEREDRVSVSWYKQQENSKGSNCTVERKTSRSSVSLEDDDDDDDDGDICILDNIRGPAHPPPLAVHVKPHPILQRSGYGDHSYSGFTGMRLKADDERLTFRIALKDLSQPKSEASPPDGVLAVPLLRHQRIALSWMVQKETTAGLNCCSGGILADDQGLGKTISTIALILMERSPSAATGKQNDFEALNLDDDDDDISDLNPTKQPRVSSPVMMSGPAKMESPMMVVKSRPAAGTLVVCPTSVLRQWADELQNKVTSKANLSFLVYHGSNRTRDANELSKYDVVLTTYAIVSMEVPKQPLVDKDGKEEGKTDAFGVPSKKRKNPMSSSGSTVGNAHDPAARPLARVGWFRVILDEAQSIKNYRTQVARACWGLRAKRRWCLSGTPIQNAVDDLYSYFRFLRYDPYCVYKSFCSTIKMPISKNPANGYKKLQAVLKTIMLRRTKGMLIDGKPIIALPPKTVTLKKVDFSNEERAFYSTLEAESREQFKVYAAAGTVKQNYVNILLMLLRLRQACDHPLLVQQYDSNSVWRSSLEMAKKLPKEKQKELLSHLEASMAICTICNDPPEDAVVTICGHVFCNQCICEHLSGDDNICPSAHCKVRLSLASVFSKGTLFSSLSDLVVDESRSCDSDSNLLDTAKMGRNNLSSHSSKIKAALEILLSLPRRVYSSPDSNADQSNREARGVLENSVDAVSVNHSKDTGDKKRTDLIKVSDVQVTEKAIVFSQWTRMLDLLEVPLKDSCIQYRRLDGTMSISAREKAVKDFNTIPEVTVMIMSLKAASLGLNMVAACHVLLLDLWWNPTTEDQAIDRAHRIGQTRPVTVSRLTVKDTVEDRILALQEKKRETVASVFGEDESGSRQSRLTVEDLEYLFNGT